MQQTLGDTLAWPARSLPNKEALVAWEGGERRVWTYAQLDAEVNRHAHGLAELGIGHGDVVAAFLYNTPAFVFTMLAAARLGADRKSTRLNSSHLVISYAVFCLKKTKPRLSGHSANLFL